MATDYQLKPFYINLNDLLYLLQQVNFVPLFDGPANSNGIVNFNSATMDAWDANGNQIWNAQTQTGSYRGTALTSANIGLLGQGFPQVSAPIGIRDVSGLHNNLFGDQAFWGTVDVPFRRDIAADFNNYVTSPGADYSMGNNVVDLMPRIISQTITTGGVNLLKDPSGHYVEWSEDRYILDNAYAALIDASGVDINTLVEGAKIVAPVTTEIAVLDGNGDPLVWSLANYQASVIYTTTLGVLSSASYGGLKDSTGGSLDDGEAIYYRPIPGGALVNTGQTYQPDVLAYKQLIDANVDFSVALPADGTSIVTTVSESGYGLLEQLGHIDFQNPNSGEFFIGSENPGVAPVNSWFAIFGQFFDHGLDLIGKGSNGKITISLDPSDPLYRAPGTNGADDPGVTKMTVTRASIAGTDANGDPNYVNHTSPFIDQSQTYGSAEQITQLLREWVPDADGSGFRAGMELFDGQTLVDGWIQRTPVYNPITGLTEIQANEVHNTLPTLSELRDHVLDTGRSALTWEDVSNYRNRDASGQLSSGDSGHALILDMNPNFDAAHLDSSAQVGSTTVAALVDTAVATLNASLAGTGMTFSQNPSGNIELVVTGGAGGANLPDGTYTGAFALAPWVNFADFSIMNPPPGPVGATEVKDAVGQILMATVGDHYIAGDGRVNENFGLTSIHHVFHEEHNYQVENLKSWIFQHDTNNPGATDAHEQLHNWQIDTLATGGSVDAQGNYLFANGEIAWDADKMFNATKLIVEMEYQHAAVDQYARTITPRIQEFVGYSSGVDPTVSLEFSQVAFRFGHSTIRETIDTVDPSGWMLGNVTRYALEKAFLAPGTFAKEGVAAITLGLSRQQMNEVDEFITPALTQGLLDQPLDLAAINIARGRDLGIPTLNDFREAISLARYTSWDDFGKNMIHPESLVNFIAAYSFGGDAAKAQAIVGLYEGSITDGSPAAMGFTASDAVAFMLNNGTSNAELNTARDGFNHIDSWIGGLAEAHVPGGLLGETFDAVFVAQIQSLMDGDRFYYLYRLFGTNIHEEVNNGQFKDIVERNTGLSHLNGSIFAYADKYYEFGRAVDGTLTGTGDDLANHLYHDTLANNPTLGLFTDGGASTSPNGSLINVTGSDFVRADVTQQYIRDVRPELDPNQVHTVEGTPTSGADSHEVIVATDNADYIHARSGDDTVYGEGGNDFIYGDGGVDRLYGGDGHDMIDTGEGPDLADGGAGKDIIYGRGSGSEVGGFDQLVGGTGNDLVIGGEGIDKLSGGAGDDIIYGDGLTNPEMGNTDAFTHGGDGNDYIDTGASGDLLYGEEGDDYLVGGIDQDLIQGGTGDDIIRPGTPSQAINGGPDEVIGDDGYTNTGFDLIDFSDYAANAPGVVADMATQFNPLAAVDGTTPFPAWFQMEGVIGSRNDDTFIGNGALNPAEEPNLFGGSNWLVGGSGNDTFAGGGGNDIIIGGSIRLDDLIGKYSDAGAEGNLVVGSTEWLAQSMETAAGGTGYLNNDENAYNGASNRTGGTLGTDGLIDAANALSGGQFEKHFTDMLKSRMFKDVVLGDNGTDGSADRIILSGAASDYTFTAITASGVTGWKVVDSVAERDGADLIVGIDNVQFDGTLNIDVAENTAGALVIAGLTNIAILGGADAALFGIEGGNLVFLAPPNFEGPADAGANNIYDVKIAGLNGSGFNITQNVAVTVTNVDEAGSIAVNIVSAARTGVAAADTVTLIGKNVVNDPDVPVTPNFLWSNGATTAQIDVVAGPAVQTITLQGGYTDAFGPKPSVTAPQTAVIGTTGDDEGGIGSLVGTTGADWMFGLDGDDRYIVNHADDTVSEAVNEGRDEVRTSLSNYTLGDNVEVLRFDNGAAADIVFTATGNSLSNNLRGGSANDTFNMIVDNARDDVNGDNGSDTADYSAYSASLTVDLGQGGGGGATVTGSGTNTGGPGGSDNRDRLQSVENFNGGAGNDDIRGGQGNNVIKGGAGNDTIRYNVTTQGGGGNPPINSGRDFIEGGANTATGDRFVLTGTNAAETFRIFTAAAASAAGLTGLNADTEIVITRNGTIGGTGILTGATILAELDNIEEITVNTLDVSANDGGGLNTTPNGDTIQVIGNFNAPNTSLNFSTITVNGSRGNDIVDITGLDSAHRIVFNSGGGSDTLVGDNRPQDVINSHGSTSVGRVIQGTAGNDSLRGGVGNDDVNGNAGRDSIAGGAGNDKLRGGAGRDSIRGDSGDDLISGGTGDDNLSGAAGRDRIRAGDGADRVSGGDGNDALYGDAGGDVIHGGKGSDWIAGGSGNDTMSGGDGDDRFVFQTGFGNDIITDFDSNAIGGQDKIDVRALGITGSNFGEHVHIMGDGANTMVFVDGQEIKLKGVSDFYNITQSDFVLFAG